MVVAQAGRWKHGLDKCQTGIVVVELDSGTGTYSCIILPSIQRPSTFATGWRRQVQYNGMVHQTGWTLAVLNVVTTLYTRT